jgi:hypothetical protein
LCEPSPLTPKSARPDGRGFNGCDLKSRIPPAFGPQSVSGMRFRGNVIRITASAWDRGTIRRSQSIWDNRIREATAAEFCARSPSWDKTKIISPSQTAEPAAVIESPLTTGQSAPWICGKSKPTRKILG